MHITGRPDRLIWFLASILMLVASCNNPIAPPTYSVKAALVNTPDFPRSQTLQIDYSGPASSGTRVTSAEGVTLNYIQTATLSVTRGGTTIPTTDGYYLQVISRPAAYINEPPDPRIYHDGDWQWMDAHSSEFFALSLQASSLSDPTSVTSPDLSPRRASASAWLATVDENDVVVPYFVAPGTPNCFSMSPTDCFDVQSIAMAFLSGATASLKGMVDPPSGGGPDPDEQARSTGGTFSISFIPNLVDSGLNQGTRRTRGVGFVLHLSFDARAAGSGVIGTPWHRVTVLFPIALYFEDDATGQLAMSIDPFDFVGSINHPPRMPDHVAVEVSNPLGTPVDATVGQIIAQSVRQRFVNSLATNASMQNTVGGTFASFFNLVRPTRPLPSNFDVVLILNSGIPDQPSPVALSAAPGASGPRLVFLE